APEIQFLRHCHKIPNMPKFHKIKVLLPVIGSSYQCKINKLLLILKWGRYSYSWRKDQLWRKFIPLMAAFLKISTSATSSIIGPDVPSRLWTTHFLACSV